MTYLSVFGEVTFALGDGVFVNSPISGGFLERLASSPIRSLGISAPQYRNVSIRIGRAKSNMCGKLNDYSFYAGFDPVAE